MQLKILGGDGGVSENFQTTSFLLNKDTLFDAGSAATGLTTAEQKKIDHVFISHCHLDHIKDLCFLIDNCFSFRKKPLKVYSTATILKHLRKYIFNNYIWPDFSVLHNGTCVVIEFVPITKEVVLDNNVRVRIFPVTHPVPAIGFIAHQGKKSILISGDTGPTKKIWDAGNKTDDLKMIFTEIAFPNEAARVAHDAGHFTPISFAEEFKKIKKDVPIWIYHLKPSFYSTLQKEIRALKIPNLKLLKRNQIIKV